MLVYFSYLFRLECKWGKQFGKQISILHLAINQQLLALIYCETSVVYWSKNRFKIQFLLGKSALWFLNHLLERKKLNEF